MRISLLLVGICLSVISWAQPNRGKPFIINYSTVEYRQGTQNFTVLQDLRGILYFGNNNGVLEFDGENWRLIKVTNQSEVHSLALDEQSGRIYVGGQGDFGYLKPDSISKQLSYVSLLPLVDKIHRNFHDVWSIYVTNDQVIFRSTAGLHFYSNNKIRTIPLSSDRHRSFYLHQTLYLWLDGKGLMQLKDDSLVMAPLGEEFAEKSIHGLLPYNASQMLVLTRDNGCFLYNRDAITPFVTEIDSIINGQNMFAKVLDNGNYAIATRNEGLLIMNREGKLLRKIDEDTGLLGSSVWDVFPDRFSGDFWLALNNGISLVEISSPFSLFGKEDGLIGQFYSMTRFKNKLYAAGSIGVFSKDWFDRERVVKPDHEQFARLKNGQAQAWHLYADEDELLVASNAGILRLNEGTGELEDIGFKDRSWFFLPLKNYPGYMMVNTVKGLYLLKKVGKRWQLDRKIKDTNESFYYFAQDELGNIWADVPTKGIFRIEFNKGISQDPSFTLYTQQHGLPTSFKVRPFDLGNEVVFTALAGVYTFQPSKGKFIRHPTWNKVLAPLKNTAIEWLERDIAGNLWIEGNQDTESGLQSVVGYAAHTLTGYQLNTDVFKKIEHVKIRDFWIVDENNVFLSTSAGIVHFNPQKHKPINYGIMLRKVEIMNIDSTIFSGAFVDSSDKLVGEQPDEVLFNLPYKNNSLRFRVSSQDMKNPKANLYQFFLEGLDKDWSSWTTTSAKEYTSLPEGSYTLHARSKNQYNQISKAQTFSFKVHPPWYRTYWAYLIYLVCSVLVIILLLKLYGNGLKHQNAWLEQLISERTIEISKQNQDIREKNQELEKAKKLIFEQYHALQNVNQQLEEKVKERTEELERAYEDLLLLKNELDTFIYKSSHDINGPMMRLRGLCQVAAMDVSDEKGLLYIDLLSKEAEKSITVLHKLLTFYHVKNTEPVLEVVKCAEVLDIAFKQLHQIRESADVKVDLYDLSSTHKVYSDPKMLTIIINQLLENALIYRREQESQIHIRIKYLSNDQLEIRIADNGIGIPTQVRDKIFNMFYRASEKSSGPGLGLYTARTAAAKLGGKVSYSKLKQWSVFKVRLPNPGLLTHIDVVAESDSKGILKDS